ncbi:MAG: zinc ribbon domain-containing protein [Solirubrobacterales bacterium]
MYCRRCGTPNEPGDRYCSSCGAALGEAGEAGPRPSFRDRLGRLAGSSPRARLVTAATAVAIVVAIVAFVALKPAKEGIPRDAYTVEADRLCLESKRDIVAIESGVTAAGGAAAVSTMGRELVPVIAAWRHQFDELEPPAGRGQLADDLDAALVEAEARLGALALVDPNAPAETVAAARRADAASTAVEEAVAALGLSECAEATIGFNPNGGP